MALWIQIVKKSKRSYNANTLVNLIQPYNAIGLRW